MDKEQIWRNLGPLTEELRERADEVRDLGGLPADLKQTLKAAGAFRIAFPRVLGGPEFTFLEQISYIQQVSAASPSVGWLEMILADSGYFASMLPPATVAELFPSIDYGAAAGRGPGRAQKVEGGVVITGRFPFVSGIREAEVVNLRLPLFQGDEPVRRADGTQVLCAAFPRIDEVEVFDTWDVEGMRGSGSTAIAVKDVFVPDHLWVDFWQDGEVADAIAPLGRYPVLMFFNGIAVLLGTTQELIETAEAHLATKVSPQGDPVLGLSHVSREHMRARAQFQAAESMVREVSRELDDHLFNGLDVPLALFGRVANTSVLAAELCRKAADQILVLAGSDHVFRGSKLNRLYADLSVAGTHIVHRPDWFERAAAYYRRARGAA